MTILDGQPANGGGPSGLLVSTDVFPVKAIPVENVAVANTPAGAKGRITLAGPAPTGSPPLDSLYQGWLYAPVADTNRTLDGLYQTNDFVRTLTTVQLSI